MRVRTPVDIGLTIRERRRALGLDQAELARRIGVSRQWIVAVEKGKPRAELGLVLRALSALGIALQTDKSKRAQAAPLVDIDAVVARARIPQ
jgi:HTH-type transcriptional regulator/antitoxin HipB